MPLSLGHLHCLIFPEKPGLFDGWQYPGSDVITIICPIKTYFSKVRNATIPGKLGSYFRPVHSVERMENLDALVGRFSAKIQDKAIECADIENNTLLGILKNRICERLESMTKTMRSGIWS